MEVWQAGTVHSASLKEIEQADASFDTGRRHLEYGSYDGPGCSSIGNENCSDECITGFALPVWQDAAIKEFVQEEKGFLANITVAGSSH